MESSEEEEDEVTDNWKKQMEENDERDMAKTRETAGGETTDRKYKDSEENEI
jgi:hypothetical protein